MSDDNAQGGGTFKFFRITSVLEGLSFIALLGIAMPLKYMYGDEQLVKIIGPIHGGLFTLYCIQTLLYYLASNV